MTVKIYHNPKCSKSRATLQLLQQQGIQPEIELYLEQQYTLAQLQDLAHKLKLSDIREMMRTNDDLYLELGLNDPNLSAEQLLSAIAQQPRLLERPIVVNGEQAKIGRPPEAVLAIL